MRLAWLTTLILGCAAWAAAPSSVSGQQMLGGVPMGFSPFGGANSGMMPGMNGMGGANLGTMMGMSMLQGFGSRGVQTGMANPFMNGYGQQPELYYEPPYNPGKSSGSKSKHASSSSKREEARAKRAEQKRLAAEAKAKGKTSKKSRKQNA